MKKICPYLFVYGSLRPAVGHPMLRRLLQDARWLGTGYCVGELYSLGRYPGAVIGVNGAGRIHGDVFLMRHPRQLLSALDRYEGCGSRAPAPREYTRAITEVIVAGKRYRVWIYVCSQPVHDKERILSGDYLAYSSEKGGRRYAP